jgi:uncharacterized protein
MTRLHSGSGRRPRAIAASHWPLGTESSIEATLRLQRALDPDSLRGRVSIIPIVNLPAIPSRSQYVCLLDGKNINFSFPGKANGTFSETVAYALLEDWAKDADCFIDLHGGDLCENVSHFTVCQTIGDEAFDRRNLELAQCFDADIIAKLDPSFLDQPARSCTGRARRRQHAAFAEAGRIGFIEERNVAFHFAGVMRVANLLGMMEDAPPKRQTAQVITRYLWVPAPADGIYRYAVEPAEKVSKGALLATVEDVYGETIGEVTAPADGLVLWRITHVLATKDSFVVRLGTS